MKRWRKQIAKPGQLKIYYGKDADGEGPDVCYAWGAGCHHADGHFLSSTFGGPRMTQDFRNGCKVIFEQSFLKELEERGYDLSTIKFSVQKKA